MIHFKKYININIVECKAAYILQGGDLESHININIVECKEFSVLREKTAP